MTVELTLLGGATRTGSLRLRKRDTLVGRQRGCDIRIPSDEVSRRHCLLYLEKGKLTVEDLNSANGTFLNGLRINGRQAIKPGDRLQIGPLTFRIDVPRGTKKLAVHESESRTDQEPIYQFADDKRNLPQGDEFRDLLRGMEG
jgi:pSer/pThr/pTyr-binding forkhead associated (FHA) protein